MPFFSIKILSFWRRGWWEVLRYIHSPLSLILLLFLPCPCGLRCGCTSGHLFKCMPVLICLHSLVLGVVHDSLLVMLLLFYGPCILYFFLTPSPSLSLSLSLYVFFFHPFYSLLWYLEIWRLTQIQFLNRYSVHAHFKKSRSFCISFCNHGIFLRYTCPDAEGSDVEWSHPVTQPRHMSILMCIGNADLAQSSTSLITASSSIFNNWVNTKLSQVFGHTQVRHRGSKAQLILDFCTKVGVKIIYEWQLVTERERERAISFRCCELIPFKVVGTL